MKEKKYPAKIGLGFVIDSNFKNCLKTIDQWKRYGNRMAKEKSKYGIVWNCALLLIDEPEIWQNSFDYVSISFYYSA